jgi:cold shock protein
MAEGIVVRFNADRGFGFIRPDDESNDLYFHCTNQVVKEWVPSPGERVQFELGENNQGPTAIAIVLLSEPTTAGTTRDPEPSSIPLGMML